MDSIARGLFVYLFLFLVFRVTGKRTLAQTTPFELVLLLIISEVTQQAMVDEDHSITNGVLLIITLVGADMALMKLKNKVKWLSPILEDKPVVIVDNGRPLKDIMERADVEEADVLQAARERHGLERMEQVKFAVLETSGEISIIPAR